MTRLEQFVTDKLLVHISPRSPSDISLWRLATRLGVEVHLNPIPTHLFGPENGPMIILDSRLPEPEQREALAHELCHFVAHAGNQLTLAEMMTAPDEAKATRMSMYLLCPTDILSAALDGVPFADDAEVVTFIASEFNIPLATAKQRLRLFRTEHRKAPQLGLDYDMVWEHPGTGRRIYFKNGHLACSH